MRDCQPKTDVLHLPSSLQCFARVWGEDTGNNRILALHGWLDNSNSWATLAPLLARAGWYIFAIDMLGHGKSSHVPHASYSVQMGVFNTALVVEQLGWDHFVLMGHSLGSVYATFIAALMPERIKGLVVIEGIGPVASSTKPGRVVAILREGILHNVKKYQSVRPPKVYQNFEKAVEARRASDAYNLTDSSIRHIVKGGIEQRSDGTVSFTHDPLLLTKTMHRFTVSEVVEIYRALKCPVLVILAENGLLFGTSFIAKEVAEERMEAVEKLTRVAVPGYHHVHLDDAPAVFPHIHKFLAGKTVGKGAHNKL